MGSSFSTGSAGWLGVHGNLLKRQPHPTEHFTRKPWRTSRHRPNASRDDSRRSACLRASSLSWSVHHGARRTGRLRPRGFRRCGVWRRFTGESSRTSLGASPSSRTRRACASSSGAGLSLRRRQPSASRRGRGGRGGAGHPHPVEKCYRRRGPYPYPFSHGGAPSFGRLRLHGLAVGPIYGERWRALSSAYHAGPVRVGRLRRGARVGFLLTTGGQLERGACSRFGRGVNTRAVCLVHVEHGLLTMAERAPILAE